jgi:2'-phosphotransferase
VRQIVDSSDKKRFALKLGPSGVHGGSAGGAAAESSSSSSSSREPGDWLIRANQGHSIKLESERLLRPIVLATGTATATADGVGAKEDGVVVEEEEEEVVSGGQEAARSQAAAGAEPTAGEAAQPSAAPMARTLSPVAVPPVVVHGTYFAFWSAIVASGGLRPMGRTHVHFSTGLPEDSGAQVVSGMRRDAELLVYVDVARSLRDGVMGWWMSDNGVVLTEGVKGEGREGDTGGGGLVPAKYFKEVVGRKRPASASTPQVGVLWKDGVKVADLPEGLPFRVPQGKGGRGGRGGGGGGGGGGQRGGRGRH